MPERIQTVRQLKEWLKAFSDQDSVWRDPGPATRQRGHVPPRGSADDHRSATARTAILGRGRKRGNEGGRARAHTIVVLSVVLLMGACGDDDAITSFSLMKVDPKESFGHEWLPLNPTVYKIHSNTVVSNTIGFMSRYDNCSVFAIEIGSAHMRMVPAVLALEMGSTGQSR